MIRVSLGATLARKKTFPEKIAAQPSGHHNGTRIGSRGMSYPDAEIANLKIG